MSVDSRELSITLSLDKQGSFAGISFPILRCNVMYFCQQHCGAALCCEDGRGCILCLKLSKHDSFSSLNCVIYALLCILIIEITRVKTTAPFKLYSY